MLQGAVGPVARVRASSVGLSWVLLSSTNRCASWGTMLAVLPSSSTMPRGEMSCRHISERISSSQFREVSFEISEEVALILIAAVPTPS